MKNKTINPKENQLCPAYLNLIEKLWDSESPEPISAKEFINILERMNPSFKLEQDRDSKDLIIFILGKMHKELKGSLLNKNIIDQKQLNQYDEVFTFNYFLSQFQKECSIISDIFFGFTQSAKECLYCENDNSKNEIYSL